MKKRECRACGEKKGEGYEMRWAAGKMKRFICSECLDEVRSEYTDDDGNVIVTSDPMSNYITDELNKVCKGVEVEHYSDNPRFANISGLFIRANIDIRKKISEANSIN